MKTRLLTYTFLFFSFYSQAQQFVVSSTVASQQGKPNEEINPTVVIKNNGSYTMELRWERVKNNLPQGWESVVCDKQCHTTYTESKSFSLAPGESIYDFRVSFRPNGFEGSANAELKIYEVKNPNNHANVSFNASSISSSSGNGPNIYPNPATEHIMVQDPNNEVKFIEVYNIVGKKISEYTVNNSSGKYDVSDLQRGMYMIRMLDRNRNIIRTQRVSKYNP